MSDTSSKDTEPVPASRPQNIPVGWETRRLSELATNHDGKRVPLKQSDRERRRGDYPYYGASGIIDSIDGFLFDGDYVLLGEDGENVVSRHLPLAFRVTGKFWVNNHAHVYEPFQNVDIRFLVGLLDATDFSGLVSGSAQPKLTQEALQRLRLVVPPYGEQRAIAAVLDTIDDAIQKTEQIIAKLQQVKQGLLHDLLTRGIDDNGELRDPERHPEQFQDSPLGRIPKGWRIGSVGEFCEVYNYLREPISEELRALKSGPFPYYGPTGILDYINEWRVEGEFVLIGEDGDHFLKFASWPMTQLVRGQFNVNNHAHILCGKADCRTHWIDTFFRHRDITLHTTRQGAGRFKLNKAALLTLPILVPSPLEQDSITADFQNAESQIGAEAHRLAKLRVLKAGLADDLLTGRVRTTSLPEFTA